MKYLLLFHGKNCYANASHYYVYTCIVCLVLLMKNIPDINEALFHFQESSLLINFPSLHIFTRSVYISITTKFAVS